MKLIFYPHIEMQKFISEFEVSNPNIIIAKFNEYDVQMLLKQSKLLITDYSSVFFDFAYMNKPVVYYQFDKDDYRKEHYSKGYFDYNDDGFGPVCYDVTSLFNEVKKILNDDCKVNKTYQSRIDSFFTIKDHKNCERIFNEIIKVSEKI